MKEITVTQEFKIAPDGNNVIEIPNGDQSVEDEIADLAISQGWAIPKRQKRTKPNKAPQNKAK